MTEPGSTGQGAMPAAHRADAALREEYARRGSPPPQALNWEDYASLIDAMDAGLGERPAMHSFAYEHPLRLQDPETGVGKPYSLRLAYSDPGGDGEPVVAIGGLTNVAQRFDFFALDAAPELRVIGLDLAGRGHSRLARGVVRLSPRDLCRAARAAHGASRTFVLHPVGLFARRIDRHHFAARYPERVRRIVLNDSGPYIPVERRARRARAVARHYVFRSPAEVFRRTGAAQKHSGPAPDAVLLHTAHHRTRWSDDEDGRVYRHDLRALLAYRSDARSSLDLWEEWARLKCPVLLIHGLQSDATTDETIDRMRGIDGFSVIHVPDTGHTPTLSDGPLIADVARWVCEDRPFAQDLIRPTADWPRRILYPDDGQSS